MVNEFEGFLISAGIFIAGEYIRQKKDEDIGNLVEGFGLGTGLGTLAHTVDKAVKGTPLHIDSTHHDLIGLSIIPITVILQAKNMFVDTYLAEKLYGIGLGMLSQHLLTEGCSFCGTHYCENGDKLC